MGFIKLVFKSIFSSRLALIVLSCFVINTTAISQESLTLEQLPQEKPLQAPQQATPEKMQRELMLYQYKLKAIDQAIHENLQSLKELKGIDSLVFNYHIDKHIEYFNTEVGALRTEFDTRLKASITAFAKYAQQGNQPFDQETIVLGVESILSHLQEHIAWYNSEKVKKQIQDGQQLAYQILGAPEAGNLIELNAITENIFFRFAENAKPATAVQMWDIAQKIGFPRFLSETGVEVTKNNKAILNDINRNLLAINALTSKELLSDIDKTITDYKKAMEAFKVQASHRFSIKSWKEAPSGVKTWKDAGQAWSIQQYQLMYKRFQAIEQMVDAKVDKHWMLKNEDLGFRLPEPY